MAYYRFADDLPKRRRKRKRLTRGKVVAFAVFLAVAALIVGIWQYFRKAAAPVMIAFAEAKVKNAATNAVNNAVYTVMSEGVCYSDLITVDKNEDGDITLIQANSVLMNALARDTAQFVQEKINAMTQVGISVPLGTLSGFTLLTGSGPPVHITVEPVGAVLCTFLSEFSAEGINQTLHKIFLQVTSEVNVIVPTSSAIISVQTPVLIAENLIVGKIPQTYLSGASVLFGQN